VARDYQIILGRREGFLDFLHSGSRWEIRDEFFRRVGTFGALCRALPKADLPARLRDEILVTPKVELVERGSLPKSEGKATRVIDRRENNA